MEKLRESMLTGLLAGIIAPLITLVVFYLVRFSAMEFPDYLRFLFQIHILTKLLSLCAIPNLAIFFIFLKADWINPAKGIIFATILFAFFVVILKYVV